MYSQAMKFSSAEPVGLLRRGMHARSHKKVCVETFAFEEFEDPLPFRCVQKFFNLLFGISLPAKSCMAGPDGW